MPHLEKVGAKLTKCQKIADYISVKQSGHLNQILIATKLVANDYKTLEQLNLFKKVANRLKEKTSFS